MRHEVVKDGEPCVGLLALPHIDPMRGRQKIDVAYGLTVGEMVVVALPGVAHDRVRVTIGEHVIEPKFWHRVRPRPGATVIIRDVPGDDTLRSVLSVAVLVAAVALGQFYAPAIAGGLLPASFTGFGAATATAGTLSLVGSLATAGFAVAGSLLLNALIPVRGLGDQDKGTDIYAITGLKNSANPGGVIPSILGRHRYAPPYAAVPYTEVIGDDQFVIAAFLFGHGPLALSSHQLGDAPLTTYSDILTEIFDGTSVPSSTLYPMQVVEEQLAINLVGVYPGRYTKMTAPDATECSIDIAFVQGLVKFDDKGRPGSWNVYFRIEQREVGTSTWLPVELSFGTGGNRQTIIRRTLRWALPTRGQYEISISRLTPTQGSTRIMDRADWSCIRSFRPESPFNFDKPVAMTVLRIRASNQLNGALDNYNAIAQVICPDWDVGTQTWVVRETSNPASLYRHVLQGPANAYPKTDDQIDIAGLQDWHEFCAAKGLTYNRVHDYNATRLDVLADIAAAGRATPHDDGVRWGVTIDRPQSTYVSAISPRNSWDFQGQTPQVLFPDGHRVQFVDETNNYNQAERIVPFPGISADNVQVTEDLPMPGVTNPDQIWKAARRRQYELIHRPHTYTVSQDIESLVVARGDMVPLNHDVLDRDHVAARVRAISNQLVTLDTPVSMQAGRSYACVFRKADGTSVRRAVIAVVGETSNLTMIGDLSGVEAGDLASFGTSIKGPVIDCIVKNVERGDNMTAKLTLIDAAPVIDDLVDADVPPAWDGRVGAEVDVSGLVPAVPVIGTISTNGDGTIIVPLTPGSGSIALPATYTVSHRLTGGGSYSTVSILSGEGYATIPGYLKTDTIDIKAHAVSGYGQVSADTAVVNRYGFLTFTSGFDSVAPGTVYLGTSAADATESNAQLTLTSAGTISNLVVSAVLAPGTSETFVYTLRKNGADTALTCTVSGDSISATDSAHSVSVGVGDKIDVKLTVSGSAAPTAHDAAVRFIAS